ncbi:cytosolic phospholipase A2-like isoform X3 [Stegodyphus dumicola]|uniref:cytosolic phospholipase A2-like isoform X3 n=1 Tax=Stegodyphus dumicola TaxID=202533 RepID=UPI0015B0F1D3|nr:cytosolic phospholipase A2-like isoform X3 [Stegodyphus dumicola]
MKETHMCVDGMECEALTDQLLLSEQPISEVPPLPSLQVFQMWYRYDFFLCFSPPTGNYSKVTPDSCNILNVTVVEAHKITKGWVGDLVDTPDPYVILRIPGSPNGTKRTKHFNNTSSPTWNEEFTFVLDPQKEYELEITLMDANYTIDEKMGCEKINLNILNLNEERTVILKFGEVTEITLKLFLAVDQNPDLRYSLSLCEKEKEFRKNRLEFIMQSLANLFPENAPEKKSQIPVIAVIGSGGGFRAMTSLGGAMKALVDTQILDCVTYVAGLSGSAWYLSTLYSHPEFPLKTPGELLDELKANIRHSPFWLLGPRCMYRYISSIKEKHRNGQPVSFTDFFGHLLGDTLLKGRCDARLSQQQEKIDGGQVPLPLYTCLHVKSNVSAKVFQDWVEFSPYEIGIAKYAAFMKTEHFGSKLYKGRIIKEFPEFPLHYLQGIWGSAFSILFKRLIQRSTKLSLDLSSCHIEESDDEEEIFFDAEEEFQDEEDTLRDAFENLYNDEAEDACSESEEELSDKNEENSSSEKCGMLNPGFWKDFINNIFTSSVLDTRKGRAGRVFNPLRGLSLIPCFPFSPFSPTSPSDNTLFKGLTEPAPTNSKTLYLVDGGLTFNLPFPLLLRPQRAVDIYISFDFSSREHDNSPPFKELLLSEKWARLNNCLFPPIHDLAAEYIKHPPKECYVFKDPVNEMCPIIIHFPLINLDFRKFKSPGIPRETKEELEFADFTIFSDDKKTYSIYNFKYPSKKFDRLVEVMEFNVLNNINVIKEIIDEVISRKKKNIPLAPLVLKDPPKSDSNDT